ncbi:hypothetical protein GLOTRDRAFT_104658 [Gloeophyllum trabeum ATCC 11539]|uniref:CMP/dCMP-type deaminase domain-containing protein n=1 Tax=Gloeophyllum trabeum (strain ATCC 11539 / FP-39264 / Madison 617) TaxID=670483 RepID=S7RR13_GLOTA|nr:uncharacterized protein GLOTRDRAFT_104658 [Gloeophyllum trabeum ATCC 11539]EPQ57015.1 hypothetical protein GLOTRDRAFT_104658 [Gloeophyllum trabeum ATCC 11539]
MPYSTCTLLQAFLDVLTQSIIPLTRGGVSSGSKVFGAAVLRSKDLSLVVAETNDEASCPLWHGEVNCIRKFYEIPREKRGVGSDECIFLSTHEPCALAWSGFHHIYFLFSYDDTRDTFAIPHDIDILTSVFHAPTSSPVPSDDLYNRQNKFFSVYSIEGLMGQLTDDDAKQDLRTQIKSVKQEYNVLAENYARGKGEKEIPLA